MSDFESRLRDGLAAHAEQAPDDASGLVGAARERRRSRRRAVGGALVAAVLVAAVPVGLAVVGGDDKPDEKQVADSSTDDGPVVPDGYRWESWRTIELAVPSDWRDGSAYDFCIPGYPSPPAGNVARDGYLADFEPDVKEQAVCPQGVTFLAGDPERPITIPDGATGKRISIGGHTVDVVAEDPAVLKTIVDSAHEIDGTDSLGCAPTIEEGAGDYGTAEGEVVVCDYLVGGYAEDRSTPVLNSSANLKAKDATSIRGILARTTPLRNADKATYGCTLRKGMPPYTVRRIQVGEVVLAEMSTGSCGAVQLTTAGGPQQVEYELLDALDPATRSLG